MCRRCAYLSMVFAILAIVGIILVQEQSNPLPLPVPGILGALILKSESQLSSVTAADTQDNVLLGRQEVAAAEHELVDSGFWGQLSMLFHTLATHLFNWQGIDALIKKLNHHGSASGGLFVAYLSNVFTAPLLFSKMNFVQGFPIPGIMNWFRSLFVGDGPKWKPAVKGETVGIMTYQEVAKKISGQAFPYAFFEDYYTGGRVPSWEDNKRHSEGVAILDAGYAAGKKAMGEEPMEFLKAMQPRMSYDTEALTKVGWDGFSYMGPHDIKYASNGVFGIDVVDKLLEKFGTTDTLGVLMTNSVFSAHLTQESDHFFLDLSTLEGYEPIQGYAPLGGKAVFKQEGGRLRTVSLEYNRSKFTEFNDPKVASDYAASKLSGWRFAEKAIIASLLSMTNLVLHVKDLHLEIAAAFQAVSVDAFADDPTHPIRRLLDPFIHRSIQATNDNFKLLFEYKAAEFSLAPLPYDEQLRLIDEAIKERPLRLAELDMENFGKVRNMAPGHSTLAAQTDPSAWGWRWHYRALTVQRLYDSMIECWLNAHYVSEDALAQDATLQKWWASMIKHLPSLQRSTKEHPEWASNELTSSALKNVLRTLFVWLSWIHEDVGHAAASYVYNPIHTPMCVPKDGIGVPLRSWAFNVVAYRGFVFLNRAVLLDKPPEHWFSQPICTGSWPMKKCQPAVDDKRCFLDLQDALKALGSNDTAFSECDKTGFYSCVDRVETAVSS